jgi:hypothetical protein
MRIILTAILFITANVFSQVPQGISYQGVAYNGSTPVTTPVSLRLSILDTSATGTAVYVETFSSVPTNAQGVFSLTIGFGTPTLNTFAAINWGVNSKFLKVEIDIANGTSYALVGTSQLMSVPYALYSQSTNSNNSLRVVSTINDLRTIVGSLGDVIYIKGHTTPGDGGGGNFIWKNDSKLKTSSSTPAPAHSFDNDGTIIQAVIGGTPNDTGRWVRQFDGYVDVRFFGAFGLFAINCTKKIQRAIDFAGINASVGDPPTKGTTVFFPNGGYIVDKIILKNGITLLGDSIDKTAIISTISGDVDYNIGMVAPYTNNYLFEMEPGPIQISMSNFNILGRLTTKGCFFFEAKTDGTHGGLWYSTFKNIKITGFNGDGIYLKGGAGSNYTIPNQFLTFENIRITRQADNSNALKMKGENGQMTFLNCQFDGYKACGTCTRSKLSNVQISHDSGNSAAVISFINSTFQDSDYGLSVDYAENITIDNCWFESLGIAINIDGNYRSCKGINIVNNRFANAGGFGSLTAPTNILNGMVISIVNSAANIANNYTTVSAINSQSTNDAFVLGSSPNNGIIMSGNTFSSPQLSKTYGVLSVITSPSGAILDCQNNKLVFVNGNPTINVISSDIGAGETLFIRANGGTVTFISSNNNIFLSNKSTLTLTNGDVAVFTKIDVGTNNATYQLTSLLHAATP